MGESVRSNKAFTIIAVCLFIFILSITSALSQTQEEDYEPIDSTSCLDCHEKSEHDTLIEKDLAVSVHEGMECLDCHVDKDTAPHQEETDFRIGCEGCRTCHKKESQEYTAHGRKGIGQCEDMPMCSDCHGGHDVMRSSAKRSKTHPINLPSTCGKCHEDLNITKKYEILFDHPIKIYESSVHGKATKGGIYVAATCNDCHSTDGTAHKIFSPGRVDSSINHFYIPRTCGKCHKGVEQDFWDGIHGQLVKRGETDAPVCTHCHGEHGIISPNDPRSPVSKSQVAEKTCSPCHESIALIEKYGLPSGRLTSFIDSYHGLMNKAGDLHVANCASCHGVHRILPSSNPTSTVHTSNLQDTCGECHPSISSALAQTPIHGISGEGLHTKAAEIVKTIYIVAIIVIIGLMVLYWLIDFGRQIVDVLKKSQVRRMTLGELWQHHILMVSFIVLVISGFALRFSESWISRVFFGWEGGFELRGTIHRAAASLFIVVALWHIIYLFTKRGRVFLKDMFPRISDLRDFIQRILYNLGRTKQSPRFKRFSYVEKVEYWALIWGAVVMIITGVFLWFDNMFIKFLPTGVLDVALVIHYYEAILASLAVLIWHFYSAVFNPKVYPMNPAWLTGKMPKDMHENEHPDEELKNTE